MLGSQVVSRTASPSKSGTIRNCCWGRNTTHRRRDESKAATLVVGRGKGRQDCATDPRQGPPIPFSSFFFFSPSSFTPGSHRVPLLSVLRRYGFSFSCVPLVVPGHGGLAFGFPRALPVFCFTADLALSPYTSHPNALLVLLCCASCSPPRTASTRALAARRPPGMRVLTGWRHRVFAVDQAGRRGGPCS